MIRLIDINKNFGEKNILKNFNLSLPSTGLFLLVGPSGVGKTTLLKIISLQENIDSGKILFDDNEINSSTHCLFENNFTFIDQDFSLFNQLNVKEFISFLLNYYKKSYDFNELLSKVNLNSQYLDKKICELSKGETERIAFLNAIISDKPVIILDEPTSNLDPNNTELIEKLIIELKKDHLLLVSTHKDELLIKESDGIIDFNNLSNINFKGEEKQNIILCDSSLYINKKEDLKLGFKNVKYKFYKFSLLLFGIIFFLTTFLSSSSLVFGNKYAPFNKLFDENLTVSINVRDKSDDEIIELDSLFDDSIISKVDNNILSSYVKMNLPASLNDSQITNNIYPYSLNTLNKFTCFGELIGNAPGVIYNYEEGVNKVDLVVSFRMVQIFTRNANITTDDIRNFINENHTCKVGSDIFSIVGAIDTGYQNMIKDKDSINALTLDYMKGIENGQFCLDTFVSEEYYFKKSNVFSKFTFPLKDKQKFYALDPLKNEIYFKYSSLYLKYLYNDYKYFLIFSLIIMIFSALMIVIFTHILTKLINKNNVEEYNYLKKLGKDNKSIKRNLIATKVTFLVFSFLLAIVFYFLLNFGLTQFTFFMYEVNFVNFPFNFLSVFVTIIILISLSMFTKINTKNKISSKKQKNKIYKREKL